MLRPNDIFFTKEFYLQRFPFRILFFFIYCNMCIYLAVVGSWLLFIYFSICIYLAVVGSWWQALGSSLCYQGSGIAVQTL